MTLVSLGLLVLGVILGVVVGHVLIALLVDWLEQRERRGYEKKYGKGANGFKD